MFAKVHWLNNTIKTNNRGRCDTIEKNCSFRFVMLLLYASADLEKIKLR